MRAILLSTDLMVSSRVTGMAELLKLQVDVAPSSSAVLDRLQQEAAALIILDLSTPGLDPKELVPQVRELESTSGTSTAVVAFASHVRGAVLSAAREAGCDEVLSRGQFTNQLKELLAKYL